MSNSHSSALSHQHPSNAPARIGMMLVNLGTTSAPEPASVRRYLAEFLSDRRVIELSPWLWQPLLHGFILRTRPGKVAEAYSKIWMQESDESPLRFYTRRQCSKIATLFEKIADNLIVEWAMRYGSPSIPDTIDSLQQRGCRRILIAPLYPQYSATTSGTVNDKVFDTLKTMRWQPSLRIMPPYYDHPSYIEALAGSIESYLTNLDRRPDILLASYHGLPQAYSDAGDPYKCHCSTTTHLLRQRLGMNDQNLLMTFQSRFGPKQWLKPYTDDTLTQLARNGKRHVAVVTPGFAVDCLETLEEMGIQNRDHFLAEGGKHYHCIPCLNDSPPGIDMLAQLVQEELSGWL